MHRGPGTVLIVVVSLVAALGACSPGPTPSTRPTSAVASPSPAGASPTTAPSPDTSTLVRVYFYLGGEPGSDGLVPVLRDVGPGDVVSNAMTALLAGPSGDDLGDRTITSAIPDDTRLLGLDVAEGVASVDLSRDFESGGGSTSMFVRLGQVVFTLTQFSNVQSVRFLLEGQPVRVFGDEGIVLDHPQTRADSEGVLPAIFVDQPAHGGMLGNPGRIAGTANVFEARFRVTLLDARGTTISDVPARASCGTGCRGTFDVTIPYAVDRVQAGTLRVWDGSMRDGRPINVREYPVGLVPAG
jgi:hypothetical protein